MQDFWETALRQVAAIARENDDAPIQSLPGLVASSACRH